MKLDGTVNRIFSGIESKYLSEDRDTWLDCLESVPKGRYVPLAYKPSFIEYQREYFTGVYEEYRDVSMVLYRGGKPAGIWPLCIYKKDGLYHFGSLGGGCAGAFVHASSKSRGKESCYTETDRCAGSGIF